MTQMRREMLRLAEMRRIDRSRAQGRHDEAKARRMFEAVQAETLAERRKRLEEWVEVCSQSPEYYAPQLEQLRAGLAELPAPGDSDSLTWREWQAVRAEVAR